MKKNMNRLCFLILILLLASCGEGDLVDMGNENPTAVLTATTIELKGRITDWTQSDRTLSASTVGEVPGNNVSISSNGDFSIVANQPKDITKAQAFTGSCNPDGSDGNVLISMPTTYHLLNLIVAGDSSPLHLSSLKGFSNIFSIPDETSVTHVDFYYFNSDSVVTGEESCLIAAYGNVKISYDLNIKKGWNSLVLTGNRENDLLTISGKTIQIPTNVSWFDRN